MTIFVGIFGVLIFLSNLVFIPNLGIQGAAIASAISALAYSLMRYGYLWIKCGMQPYSYKHLLIILVAVISYSINLTVPDLYSADNHTLTLLLDILVRSGTIAISYIILIRIFRLSPDLETWIRKLLKKSD